MFSRPPMHANIGKVAYPIFMTIGTTLETESWKKKCFCVTHDWNDAIIILKELNNKIEVQRAWNK